MISIQEYDEAEAYAIDLLPQLYVDNKWGDIPEQHGQLFKVSELGALQILLNRFQCDRYRTYMYELGGLSREDLIFFHHVRGLLRGMQQLHYPLMPPQVPVETILSAMAVHRKIRAVRPDARHILEVGPGAGLNAFFFCDPLVYNYTQIEATQATYLSQAMVNDICFGGDKFDIWEAARTSMVWPPPTARLWHVPWWRVDDLFGLGIEYDVITANACLNEISNEMVARYLALFAAKSHAQTILLLQDLGAWMFRDEEGLKQLLDTHGWVLCDVTSNYEIEATVGNCGHGDAVTTWWLARQSEPIRRPVPRCSEGKCELDIRSGKFRLPGNEREWGHDELVRGDWL